MSSRGVVNHLSSCSPLWSGEVITCGEGQCFGIERIEMGLHISHLPSLFYHGVKGIARRLTWCNYIDSHSDVHSMVRVPLSSDSTFYSKEVILKLIFPRNIIYLCYYNQKRWKLIAKLLAMLFNSILNMTKMILICNRLTGYFCLQ